MSLICLLKASGGSIKTATYNKSCLLFIQA